MKNGRESANGLRAMKKQNTSAAGAKKPYEPPKATFVSLRLEERLMACGKLPGGKGKCGKVPQAS